MFKAVCYNPLECQVITAGTDRKVRLLFNSWHFMNVLHPSVGIDFPWKTSESHVSINWRKRQTLTEEKKSCYSKNRETINQSNDERHVGKLTNNDNQVDEKRFSNLSLSTYKGQLLGEMGTTRAEASVAIIHFEAFNDSLLTMRYEILKISLSLIFNEMCSSRITT